MNEATTTNQHQQGQRSPLFPHISSRPLALLKGICRTLSKDKRFDPTRQRVANFYGRPLTESAFACAGMLVLEGFHTAATETPEAEEHMRMLLAQAEHMTQ